MTIQTFEKRQGFVKAIRYEGGRESALEICRWVGNNSAYIPSTNTDPREYVQVPTMFGPRDITAGNWVVQVDKDQFLTYKAEVMESEFKVVDEEEHRLIKHARAELAKFPGEDPNFIESIISAIKGFASYPGHSGSSAAIAVHMLTALLNGENLLPLTDDPAEWTLHKGEDYGMDYDLWQNNRNSKAISKDGGKTYFLSDDPETIYNSDAHDFTPEIDPDDLLSLDEKYEEIQCSVPGHRVGRVDEEAGVFYCPDCEAEFVLTRKVKSDAADLS